MQLSSFQALIDQFLPNSIRDSKKELEIEEPSLLMFISVRILLEEGFHSGCMQVSTWVQFWLSCSDISCFVRCTSHVNIPGNAKADCAAKSALSLPVTNVRFPAYDLAPHVSKFCLKEWQDIWDACQGNKLYAVYPNVGGCQYKWSLSRRDAVLINRLRIGHTRLTHSYLLSGDDHWSTSMFCLSVPAHC